MPVEVSSLSLVKDVVIAIAAFTGMGLSFYNLWSQNQKEKIKLKVIPKSVKTQGASKSGKEFTLTTENEFNYNRNAKLYAFEIINLSDFNLTIDEVGFLNSKTKGRDSIPEPIMDDKGKWPRKLEPRESVTVYADLGSVLSIKSLPFITSVFAKTSCNHTVIGTSNSLKQLVQHSKQCT